MFSGLLRRRVGVFTAAITMVALSPVITIPSVGSVAAATTVTTACPWVGSTLPISQRVEEVMAQMTEAEELELVDGVGGSYVGVIPAIPALCIPSINLQDGPQGVGDGMTGVTQMPAPVAAASTWDTGLEQQYGTVVGAEQAGKGSNVDLGPTINIVRDPRWGRAFETFGEDPYLSGQMGAAYVEGVQSQGIMAQVKHYAVYNNETNRNTSADDDVVSERAEQEIYMPAFQTAVNAGVDSMMCAYSQPNGVPACQDPYLLGALDNQMGFQGYVTSDWGATQSTVASIEAGEDMDMPGDAYFGSDLEADIPSQVPIAYLDDAVERILTELFTAGLIGETPTGSPSATVTTLAHMTTATQVAEEGTVLLKNSGNLLPLNPSTVGSIAVIGADASTGVVYSGGGSAGVNASSSVTPLQGIQSAVGSGVTVTYNDGSNQSAAVTAAQAAKVAVIFADYTESEGYDLSSIDLGTTEDNLIGAVGAANPNTIVVLNTGSAVTMPWLGSVAGVLEQWYPGEVDGTAIAAILFGSVDPSGHLPVTFPTSLSQVSASTAQEFPGANGQVAYNEGIDVGYRWYQANNLTPSFPFGFGLSYTTFSFSNLAITGFSSSNVATVSATVTNTGAVAGSDVAQLYIGDPSSTGEPPWQLKGFDRVSLDPHASTTATFSVPVHDLAYWDNNGWAAPAGSYAIGVGDASANLPLQGTLTLANAVGNDTVNVTNPGNQSSTAGSSVDLPITATDSAAGQTLQYTATALPGGLYLDPSTGVITGTPLHSGSNTVIVTVTDQNADQASVSFTWTVTGNVTPILLSRAGWTASTNTSPASYDVPANALDGNEGTRFSTDAYETSGQYFEVNMQSPQTFDEIDMDSGGSIGDYARGYNVEVSNNGTSWTSVATGTGTSSPEIVTFPTQTAQYIEVVLTASSSTNWWSLAEFTVYAGPSTGGGGAYGGTPAAVPGTVEAANYDTGGQGVAYNVNSVNGTANSYRSDGVDLEACADTGCGYDIGWTATGQWFRYTVDVATAGTYTVSFRVAAPGAVTDALHIADTSGNNLSGNVSVPATGTWQTWTTVTANLALPTGPQTLVVDQDNPGWNIYYMAFAGPST
jgi:beta-glucosidase